MRSATFLMIFSLSGALSIAFVGGPASAKGLNDLAEDKPEAAEDNSKDDSSSEGGDAAEDTKPTEAEKKPQDGQPTEMPAQVQSASSKALANNLYLASSFGWATASRSGGKWKGAGMSDITVGYKIPANVVPKGALWGTYRYAPVAVAGEVDGISYRGVWEGHNFGALASLALSEKLNLLGSFELAYVLVYLRPLDNIEAEKKSETNGVMANIGGGADWGLMDKLSAGPRVHIGVGGFTVVQVSGELAYKF